jgi:transcriptional regulator with XRE-family HTH domain
MNEAKNFFSTEETLIVILGERIRKRRLDMGLSIEQISSLSGISRSMLGLIESGKSSASILTLWKLSKALRFPLNELLPDSKEDRITLTRKNDLKPNIQFSGKIQFKEINNYHEQVDFFEVQISHGKFNKFAWIKSQRKQNIIIKGGSVELIFNHDSAILEEGDSASFFGRSLIEIRNENTDPAVVYWISFI